MVKTSEKSPLLRLVPGNRAHEAFDVIYLTNEMHQSIASLDEIKSAIWRLLLETSSGMSAEGILEVFQIAFPDAERSDLSGRVKNSIAELQNDCLLYAVEENS